MTGPTDFTEYVDQHRLNANDDGEEMHLSNLLWLGWRRNVLDEDEPFKTRGILVADIVGILTESTDPWGSDPLIGAGFQGNDGNVGLNQDMLWGWQGVGDSLANLGWASDVRVVENGPQNIHNYTVDPSQRAIAFTDNDPDHTSGFGYQMDGDCWIYCEFGISSPDRPYGEVPQTGTGGARFGIGFTDLDFSPATAAWWAWGEPTDNTGGVSAGSWNIGVTNQEPSFSKAMEFPSAPSSAYLSIHRVGTMLTANFGSSALGQATVTVEGPRDVLTVFTENCPVIISKIKAYNRAQPRTLLT